MDVTFTNVLEGARQYFQGLPAGSGSSGSPAYPDGHHRNEHEQNGGERPPSSNYWPHSQQEPRRTPTRELTPVQQPQQQQQQQQESSRQYMSSQYPNSYPETAVSQSQFQFPRPHSREAPSNHNHPQYQPHIATSAMYQQPAAPQQARRPQESQLVPPHSYQNYAPQSRYYPQQRPVSTSTTSYPVASSQVYQQSQQNAYYKHIYTSQPPTSAPSVPYSTPGPSSHHQQRHQESRQPTSAPSSVVASESFKTTHNLPPIAALSAVNYHSRNNREPIRPNVNRHRTSSISMPPTSHPHSSASIIQNTSSAASYNDYRSVPPSNSQPVPNNYQYPTISTQSYSSVIMTSAPTQSTFATPYQSSTQYHLPSKPTAVQQAPRSQPPANILANHQSNIPQNVQSFDRNVNGRLAPVLKPKRESPLDLSVKTVRTSADSTLDDAENDARMKFHHTNRMSMPSHNYPVHDVQRNFNQRTQVQQSASAPKVEFRPNFDIRSYVAETPRVPIVIPDKAHTSTPHYPPSQPNRYPTVPIPTAHLNTYVQQKRPEPPIPRIDLTTSVKSSTSYSQVAHDINKKRQGEPMPPMVPRKLPRNDDNAWRQSIDLQIDQKLSNYKQEQQQKYNCKLVIVNGARPVPNMEPKKEVMRQNPSYHPYPNYHQPQPSHNQTYVPSPATHQYPPGYANTYVNQHPYSYPRPQSGYPSNKNNVGGGADKRVIDMLRISLEQKKLEQSKMHEGAHARSDVQHPSTDVTAPIQPKPGLISRNNVSPFTPTSFQETNSGMTIYKFPKAIDSVNSLDVKANNDVQTIISNPNNTEFDGLAALVAARIRTKGELKQGGPTAVPKNQNTYHELKSPIKQETTPYSSSSTNTCSVSPPKVIKERASLIPPRRRLFSRNEDEQGHNNNNVPPRDKSGLRSSSETSVFDFPDSDSENDTQSQSLHAMRRDRKASVKHAVNNVDVNIKVESPRAASPGDDIFGQMCDNFMQQLKTGDFKKKGRRRKGDISSIPKIETPREIVETVVVKTEPIENEPEQPLPTVVKEEGSEIADLVDNKPKELVLNRECVEDVKITKPLRRSLSCDIVLGTTEDKKPTDNTIDLEQTQGEVSTLDVSTKSTESSKNDPIITVPLVTRPPKKPSFGDGSDFYPGWEESVYKYKKSLRMPANLIRVTKPQKFHRLSTSLPDLDPCPISPSHSVTTEGTDTSRKLQKIKSEPMDSDADSNCSFNLFSKQSNYDSEGGSSIRSLPNTAREGMSILDRLLEKYGNKKKRKYKKKEEGNPKIIPKAENLIELLPTPSLESNTKEKDKKLQTAIVKKESTLLEFRKKTMDIYKEEFIKNSKLLGVNKFETVVLNSRTRKETRVMKQRATIKEVFGDDRPASAPPVTCVDEIRIKQEVVEQVETSVKIKQEPELDQSFQSDILDTKLMLKNKLLQKGKKRTTTISDDKNIKAEGDEELEEDIMKDILIKRDPDNKSSTPSIDDEGSMSGKKRSKFRNMRRKFSSGFDYIRKKKKVKKEVVESENTAVKAKRRGTSTKANPESEQDIQKEIKTWVLNKGIGETHLHRAARLGYTDITAYCLEKMECQPSPKDNAGYTPLHEACSRGHLDIAKLLLKYGANVSESAQGGIRPLHEAVENGFIEIARLLLSYGADPSLATYSGLTPVSLAKDETTMQLLKDHIDDINGVPGPPWCFMGFYSETDLQEIGYNIFDDAPDCDQESEDEDIEFEVSDSLLPNLYTLRGENANERWVLLQDLSNFLQVKSRDTLMKQICPASPSTSSSQAKVLREMKMTDFLEQARCCQFLNAGEKINTRASKIALVKYTERVKELLNIESVVITAR